MATPAARRRSLDTAVALWVALWVLVGVWTGVEVWRLSGLTQTIAESGVALDDAGSALESLRGVPLVGGESAELGSKVRANGADIVDGAAQARGSFRRLSVLLGVTIVFVPTVPVVAMHRVLRHSGPRNG